MVSYLNLNHHHSHEESICSGDSRNKRQTSAKDFNEYRYRVGPWRDGCDSIGLFRQTNKLAKQLKDRCTETNKACSNSSNSSSSQQGQQLRR